LGNKGIFNVNKKYSQNYEKYWGLQSTRLKSDNDRISHAFELIFFFKFFPLFVGLLNHWLSCQNVILKLDKIYNGIIL
jgi:hypothetical protein